MISSLIITFFLQTSQDFATPINREILNEFDEGIEVRRIFPDISKAFDKVWDDGLIF